jgi:hypothetical protein
MILGGSLPKLCLAFQTSDQDGRHSVIGWFSSKNVSGGSAVESYVKLSSAVQPSWSEGGTTRHNFGRGPSNEYFIKVWFQLSNWFQTRRFLCEFPIGSYVKLSPAVALSHQNGHHSAVALLLKAALIQVSDYRLLGASC